MATADRQLQRVDERPRRPLWAHGHTYGYGHGCAREAEHGEAKRNLSPWAVPARIGRVSVVPMGSHADAKLREQTGSQFVACSSSVHATQGPRCQIIAD